MSSHDATSSAARGPGGVRINVVKKPFAAPTAQTPDPQRAELERTLADAVVAQASAEVEFGRIVDASRSVSTDDEHDPEGVGLAVERALIVAALERSRARQEAARTALARLADGTYGRCGACGADIDAGRIAALPLVTLCYACSAAGRAAR